MAYGHSPLLISYWGFGDQTISTGRVTGAIGQRTKFVAGQGAINGGGHRFCPGLAIAGCQGATTDPKVDEDRQGAPYAAGELLVTYEPDTSEQHIDAVAEESEARIEEEISTPGAQLLSFPAVKHERSEHAREKKLQRAKETLQREPGVEHVDYNYLRLPSYVPNDPEFRDGSQWGLR